MFLIGLLATGLVSIVGLLRLTGMLWTGHLTKIPTILLVLLAGLHLASQRPIRFDGFAALVLGLVPVGILVGIINYFSGVNLAQGRTFYSHIFGALFVGLIYLSAYNAEWEFAQIDRVLGRLLPLIILVYSLTILSFFLMQFRGSALRFGIGTGALILAVVYYLERGKYWLAGLPALLILASGKRGSILALFLVLPYYFPGIRGGRILIVRSAIALVMALALVLGIFALQDSVLDHSRTPVVYEGAINRWYALNPTETSFDADSATAGRTVELRLSLRELGAAGPMAHLLGLGYGWSYFHNVRHTGSTTFDFYRHYVHLSPLNWILLYGWPLGILLLFLLARTAARAWRFALPHASPTGRVLVMYFVGAFFVSFTGYNFVTDPMMWMALGIVSGSRMQYRTVLSRG